MYKNFIVGKILKIEKHSSADRLSICRVDIGEEILNIICGAQNIVENQKVCVAKIGAIIPELGFEIKETSIRGEKSYGMICAEDELKISEDHAGIMVLNPDAQIGQEFSRYLEEYKK